MQIIDVYLHILMIKKNCEGILHSVEGTARDGWYN